MRLNITAKEVAEILTGAGPTTRTSELAQRHIAQDIEECRACEYDDPEAQAKQEWLEELFRSQWRDADPCVLDLRRGIGFLHYMAAKVPTRREQCERLAEELQSLLDRIHSATESLVSRIEAAMERQDAEAEAERAGEAAHGQEGG